MLVLLGVHERGRFAVAVEDPADVERFARNVYALSPTGWHADTEWCVVEAPAVQAARWPEPVTPS